MSFGDMIDRSGATALIPEEASREIIKNVPQQSSVMRLARKLPNMSRTQLRMPVLAALINAYFPNAGGGDTGLIGTSSISWKNKYVQAEELAVIVPVPKAVLNDADYDIWGEVKPGIEEAFGRAFDKAVLFGANAPTSWPTNIRAQAVAAGNNVALGTGTDLYDDLLSEGGVWNKVELDGFDVTGSVAATGMKAKLRGLRDANGRPIFQDDMKEATRAVLAGSNVEFPKNGGFMAAATHLIAGDWEQLVYSIREGIEYSILDQAVIQDAAGNIVLNLAQQNAVALKAVMYLGWQLPNPVNALQETESDRCPFAVLTT